MSYVDSTYYKETFKGTIIPDEGIENKLERGK